MYFNRHQDDFSPDDSDDGLKVSNRDNLSEDANNSNYYQLKSGHKIASTIDLHFFPEYVSVVALYDLFLQLYYHQDELEIVSYRGLGIIPGKGKHVNPDGRRGVLRQAIDNFLRNNIEPKGILEYRVSQDNDGLLFVPGERILRWAQARSQMKTSNLKS